MKYLLILIIGLFHWNAFAVPSVCTLVNSKSFNSTLNLKVSSPYLCNVLPPKFCTNISYRVPQVFIETVAQPRETFFSGLPGAAVQLGAIKDVTPFAAGEDNGGFSYHSHITNVLLTMLVFRGLPCGGTLIDNYCFTAMSEHLGSNWRTGLGDKLQPVHLAWSLSPKLCLLKGAATSAVGGSRPSGYPNTNMCSIDRSWLKTYPPSNHEACNGWGVFYPRYGTSDNSDRTTASLMIASRMKSLGSEIFQSVPSSFNERWTMVEPQESSNFAEGQNIAILRGKRVSEWGRLRNGKLKNHLYSTWKQVSCVRDASNIPRVKLWPGIMKAICAGFK